MCKIVPQMWYSEKAEEAVRFYVSLIPDSHLDCIFEMPADSPSGPKGSVKILEFTLAGRPFVAINAGPLDEFNHAISFMIQCDIQSEIDDLWTALSAGGSTEQCGWLRDRYGVAWQIVPTILNDLIKHPDRERAKRAAEAMLGMTKLDIKELMKAFDFETMH